MSPLSVLNIKPALNFLRLNDKLSKCRVSRSTCSSISVIAGPRNDPDRPVL